MSRHYWVSNAAQEHVNLVREKGYTQVNNGPKEPLEQMNKGDWIVYYSPTLLFERPDTPCHTFSGISCLVDDTIYPQDPTNPVRWRRNAQYFDCKPQHVKELHQHLDFMKQYEHWLESFTQSIFEISRSDFTTIANKIIIPTDSYSIVF